MKLLRNIRGFSVIEMLIAAMISLIVVGSALSVYLTQHKHMIVQDQISDMQQNIRAGMQELATKIRMAGYNVPRGLSPLTAHNTNPDTIEIVYDSEALNGVEVDHEMPLPSSEIRCSGDISPLHDGDWVYIYDPTTESGEFFEVTQVQIGSSHLQHNTMPLSRTYGVGSQIIRMNKEKYYIDDTTDPRHPKLMQVSIGRTPQVYGDNITDLQIKYVLSSGAVVDVPILATMIREVLINLTARTERADNESYNQYRTRSLQTKVMVRNLAIN
jgi:hypothetical protein